MAEKLASSSVERILSLIDDALDDGPCWRCCTSAGTGGTGLCAVCAETLRSETVGPVAAPASVNFDDWLVMAEACRAGFSALGEAFAHIGAAINLALGPLKELGLLAEPTEPVRPLVKPLRVCPRHGVVMTGGLCRPCVR